MVPYVWYTLVHLHKYYNERDTYGRHITSQSLGSHRHTWSCAHWPMIWSPIHQWLFLCGWCPIHTHWWLNWTHSQSWWWTSMGTSYQVWWMRILDCWQMQQITELTRVESFHPCTPIQTPLWTPPIKGKLICKHKHDSTRKIVYYKVQYVVKGFTQWYGVDYDKTTAPTVHLKSFGAIPHIATLLNWELCQFNIKTAFLHGILPKDETMFMEQPPGFKVPGKEEWVMKLMKSVYSMKQASHIWNQTFHKVVSKWGFECLHCKWCIYHWTSSTGTIIFAVSTLTAL